MSGKANHPYHLVDPSILPFIGAFAAFLLAGGGVLFMHGHALGSLTLSVGAVAVLAVMASWWQTVVHEAFTLRLHSRIVKIGLRYGMALFIASDVMFFVAFFWAFFDGSLYPSLAIGGIWPPKGIEAIDPFHLPLLMTLILLLSGTTLTWSHYALIQGDKKSALRGLELTILLGIIFTAVQGYEYLHASFGIKDTVFGATFYMTTGFHGLHVLIGNVFLIVCYVRMRKDHFTPDDHFGFEASAWYWHFVDIVWLFVFCSVYVWGGAGGGGPTLP